MGKDLEPERWEGTGNRTQNRWDGTEPHETAKWLHELSEPRPGGEKVKVAIARAAKAAKLPYWRAFDIWYSKARQVETFEIEQIAAAIQAKNEKDAANELRDLKARLTRLESLLASGDANFHSPSIDHARELVRQLGGPYRPLAR